MTSRNRVVKTLNHEPVDCVPRDLWTTPGVDTRRNYQLAEIQLRFPSDIQQAEFRYPRGERAQGKQYSAGEHTDAWGCTWQAARRGIPGLLKNPPLADLSGLATYQPPRELLEKAKFSGVNRQCATTTRFVLGRTETRPFERLQSLRGTEAALYDLAYGTKEARRLLAMLHDFFCREMEMWASTGVDGVHFQDDWGTDCDLLVSRDIWHDMFRPLYADYCEILHRNDKFAFFHSNGEITSIFPELVEIGIDAIHCQLSCMDIEDLARRFRGRITFWGEIDQQQILQLGSFADIREAVRRLRRVLDYNRGGVIAQCQWSLNVPLQNMVAFFDEWLHPLSVGF